MNDFSICLEPEKMAYAFSSLQKICKTAWQQGLMSGFSGNASILLDSKQNNSIVAITDSGSAKGFIEPENCILLNLKGHIIAGKGKPSSEYKMHLSIYNKIGKPCAILHTHPANMQALQIVLNKKNAFPCLFLSAGLYEADYWKKRLAVAKDFPPGSDELAEATADAFCNLTSGLPCAVWMPLHGLCAVGSNLSHALSITEELEHLAKVQLKTIQCGGC